MEYMNPLKVHIVLGGLKPLKLNVTFCALCFFPGRATLGLMVYLFIFFKKSMTPQN